MAASMLAKVPNDFQRRTTRGLFLQLTRDPKDATHWLLAWREGSEPDEHELARIRTAFAVGDGADERWTEPDRDGQRFYSIRWQRCEGGSA